MKYLLLTLMLFGCATNYDELYTQEFINSGLTKVQAKLALDCVHCVVDKYSCDLKDSFIDTLKECDKVKGDNVGNTWVKCVFEEECNK